MKNLFYKIVGCLTAMMVSLSLAQVCCAASFHPEKNYDSDFFRMDDDLTVADLVAIVRYIAEDDELDADRYDYLRFDINCDGLVDLADFFCASDFLQKSAVVEATVVNHEEKVNEFVDTYCDLLAQINSCTTKNISVIYGFYPDLVLPYINFGRNVPAYYVVERVFSYSDGNGIGTVTSMPDPYYNTIEYEQDIDAGKTVMTLIVYQYKSDGVTASIIDTAEFIF